MPADQHSFHEGIYCVLRANPGPVPKCVSERSFKEEVIVKLFDFESVELITPKDIETTDGRTARKRVIDNLKDAFLSDIPGESDYDI